MLLSQFDASSRRIVEAVLRHGPLSRADMVERLGLSSGSLTRLTGPLLAAGILREGEPRAAAIGRPRQPLEVVDDAARFLGVKVVSGRIYGTLVGLSGVVHATAEARADTSSAETTADAIAASPRAAFAADWAPEAIGVSLAAAVDAEGNARAAGFLGWEGGNIVRAVEAAAGLLLRGDQGRRRPDAGRALVRPRPRHPRLRRPDRRRGRGVRRRRRRPPAERPPGIRGAARPRLAERRAQRRRGAVHRAAAGPRVGAAAGRTLDAADLLADDPAVGAVLDDAADALGELVALAMIAYGPERVLIAGEGVSPFVAREAAIRRGIVRHAYEGDQLPELVLGEGLDFFDWARGAAALAIRHVLR